MVENSLGRVWLEAHPESDLRQHMPYYLESENPAPSPNRDLRPEDLSVIDPACGSGHILVYAFDLLAHIYREQGHAERDIPALILTHNLHGLDIDERAAQLASFAVVMKARALNSRLFRRDMPPLNILQVRPTRHLKLPNSGSRDMLGNYTVLSGGLTDADAFNPNDWQPLLDAFADADHLGSLITPSHFDAERLRAQLRWLRERGTLEGVSVDELAHLLKQAELLARKYDAVVANPPYMGSSGFSEALTKFVRKNYQDYKADLYSVFAINAIQRMKRFGFLGLITFPNWMFLSAFYDFRREILENKAISSLIHIGRGMWGSDFGSVSFVIRNQAPSDYSESKFKKLYNNFVEVSTPEEIEERFFSSELYALPQKVFVGLPNYPIAHWLSRRLLSVYEQANLLGQVTESSNGGQTSNNDRFLRIWHEVEFEWMNWIPYLKGGNFRRWYGNHDYLVNWSRNGKLIDEQSSGSTGGREYIPKEGISWTDLTAGGFSARYKPKGHFFDHAGPCGFSSDFSELLLFLNSAVALTYVPVLNSTVHFQAGDFRRLPWKGQNQRAIT